MKLKINKEILKKSLIISAIVSIVFIVWNLISTPRILKNNFWVFILVVWIYFVNPFLPLLVSSYFGLLALQSKNRKGIFWLMPLVSIISFALIMFILGIVLKFGPKWNSYVIGKFIYVAFVSHISYLYYSIPISGLNFLFFSPVVLAIVNMAVAFIFYSQTKNKKTNRKRKK